jgi:imidazole glycerol-phosphate synthase subunit HisF
MLKKRIIPCLDIKDGRTVKGINFIEIRDAGDPVLLAKKYVEQRADELVFLDITATIEKRKTFAELVEKIAAEINIPFTVGGGIETIDDVALLISAGADKISINSSAFRNPSLIAQVAKQFGSQCVVIAIDTGFVNNDWIVYIDGGRTQTKVRALDWALTAEKYGAGEILLTSMDADGTKSGFSIEITRELSKSLNIPVIASGGAGSIEHFREVFTRTTCSAALAASIFHYGEISIPELKEYLAARGINVRI